MPLNTSNFPAKPQRLLEQWGASPSAQQDSHPPYAASELGETRVGSPGSTWAALLSHSSACQSPLPWLTGEWPFWKQVQVMWEIFHLKQHLGLEFLQGKLSFMTEGLLGFFFSVPAWPQNDILSHNCCFRQSTGPIHVAQIRNIYWSCHFHI